MLIRRCPVRAPIIAAKLNLLRASNSVDLLCSTLDKKDTAVPGVLVVELGARAQEVNEVLTRPGFDPIGRSSQRLRLDRPS